MNLLVIPTTDWIHHPVPNRLNFIFDVLAEKHNVYVLHFQLRKFSDIPPRDTRCMLIEAGTGISKDLSIYYLITSPLHFYRIQKVVREKNIDIILSANILPSFFANCTGIPVVFDYLDHLEESASVYYTDSILSRVIKVGVRLITRYNLKRARSVITVTEELCEYLNSFGIHHTFVIPNGVDTKVMYQIPKEEAKSSLGITGHVLGYAGSLEYWVDLETVVRALPRLDTTLLVVGPGLFTDYGEKIRALAAEEGVSDKVIFTGPVPYSELPKYISAMDIGLNPLKKMKKNEYAAGGKVFNYLACGRPVLSSRMISLVNLLKDDLYYYDDVTSFINQVQQILREPLTEERFRKIAERYEWRILAEKYEKVLMKAV